MISTAPKPHFTLLATSFAGGPRPRNAALILSALWLLLFFAALFTPPLLDDADATHANAAVSMLHTGDYTTLHVNGVRYLEKAPLPYWLAALSMALFGQNTFAVHLPQAIAVALLALLGHRWANQAFGSRTAFYTAIAVLTSAGTFLFTRILIPEVLLSLLLATALFAFQKALTATELGTPSFPESHPRKVGLSSGASTPVPESPSQIWYAGPHFYPYVLWSTLALAVLAKGLVALVFVAVPALLFLTLTSTWRDWLRLKPFSGLTLFLAIAAPWHILAALRNPATPTHHGFLWFYFWNEHVLRFLGRREPRDYQKLPDALFWLQHLVWLFPWTLFLPLGLAAQYRRYQHQTRVLTASVSTRSIALPIALASILIVVVVGVLKAHQTVGWTGLVLTAALLTLAATIALRRRQAGLPLSPFHRIDPQQRTILLLALFAATVLLFFSFSTNQEYYTFPAYLPLLLLTAATITRAEQTYSTSPESQRWITFAHATFTVLGLSIALTLATCLFLSRHLPYNPDIGALLLRRHVAEDNLSLSHLFDLTTAAFAALRLPSVLTALAFLLGPAAAWHLRMQRRHLAATTTIAFTSAVFLFAAHLAFARFTPMLSSKAFADTILHLQRTHQIAPDTQVLLYGDQSFGSSIPFYLHQPIQLVEGRTTSMEFGSTFPDAPGIFHTDADLRTQWGQGSRKIIVIPAQLRDQAARDTPNAILLDQQSGKLLLTDRPLPHPSMEILPSSPTP